MTRATRSLNHARLRELRDTKASTSRTVFTPVVARTNNKVPAAARVTRLEYERGQW